LDALHRQAALDRQRQTASSKLDPAGVSLCATTSCAAHVSDSCTHTYKALILTKNSTSYSVMRNLHTHSGARPPSAGLAKQETEKTPCQDNSGPGSGINTKQCACMRS